MSKIQKEARKEELKKNIKSAVDKQKELEKESKKADGKAKASGTRFPRDKHFQGDVSFYKGKDEFVVFGKSAKGAIEKINLSEKDFGRFFVVKKEKKAE